MLLLTVPVWLIEVHGKTFVGKILLIQFPQSGGPLLLTALTTHFTLKEYWMRPITNSTIILFCVWHVEVLIRSLRCTTFLPSTQLLHRCFLLFHAAL